MYNEKVLNSVQTWLLGFSAMHHYTTNLMRLWHTTKDEKERHPIFKEISNTESTK
jgi:hypothetical protein